MSTKVYCVHVHPRPYLHENVRASSPRAAEAQVIARDYAGDYSNISHAEVMWQCPCGTDNALDDKACGECGLPS